MDNTPSTPDRPQVTGLAVAPCSADWQVQIESLVCETRGMVAVPSDSCVIQSLAAQTILARREHDRLREENRALRKMAADDSWSKELQDALDAIPLRYIKNDYWVNAIARMADDVTALKAEIRDMLEEHNKETLERCQQIAGLKLRLGLANTKTSHAESFGPDIERLHVRENASQNT